MSKTQEYLLDEATAEETMNGAEDMDTVEVYIEAEETTGFWNEHGNKVGLAGAGLAAAAAGFTGGFFTGKRVERKKREMFMDEIIKNMAIIKAKEQGLDTVDHEGVSYPTATHQIDNVDDLHEIITNNFLKDKKVKEEERMEWINIAIELAKLGEMAKLKQFKSEIIVDEEPKAEEKKNDKK